MEELQDAIEDALYVNAMHDETPKPTKDWKVKCLFIPTSKCIFNAIFCFSFTYYFKAPK